MKPLPAQAEKGRGDGAGRGGVDKGGKKRKKWKVYKQQREQPSGSDDKSNSEADFSQRLGEKGLEGKITQSLSAGQGHKKQPQHTWVTLEVQQSQGGPLCRLDGEGGGGRGAGHVDLEQGPLRRLILLIHQPGSLSSPSPQTTEAGKKHPCVLHTQCYGSAVLEEGGQRAPEGSECQENHNTTMSCSLRPCFSQASNKRNNIPWRKLWAFSRNMMECGYCWSKAN